MQLVNNDTQTNTWATTQHIDYNGADFDQGSIQLVYTDATTVAKTFGGLREVDRIIFATKAGTTNGDYFVINDYLGASWAIGLDTLGTGAATPTGAAWVAVAAANKTYLDISAATSGTDVAAAVETAIDLLVGFTDVIATTPSTVNLDCTAAWAGVVSPPLCYSRAGAAGTGSITKSVTTAGTSAAVNTTTDVITKTAHGQVTGAKVALTTAGTLPTGLSATTYYVIKLTADTFQLASSLANAAAGTAVDITTPGFGTHTITPALLVTTGAVAKLQVSNDGTNFTDVTSATVTITAAGSVVWIFGVQSTGQPFRSKIVRLLFTPTTGSVTLSAIPCFFKG